MSDNNSHVLVQSRTKEIPAYGFLKIVALEVYWDAACTNVMIEVNWGTCEPGGTYNITAYIKNKGNVPMNVTFCATNWVPSLADTYMDFACGSEYNILVNEVRAVSFTLVIATDIQNVTDFSFDIVVVGEG